MQRENLEQPMHPIYRYALITDADEGLILTNVDTLADGEFRNNTLERALTWNPDGRLTGARQLAIAGSVAYIATPNGIAVADLATPLAPRLLAFVALADVRALAVQFRYLFATTSRGLEIIDITRPAAPRTIVAALVPLGAAQGLTVSRTYAYVANGHDGLAIVDITRPVQPRVLVAWNAGGRLDDARDVIVASTNASLFAYVANGARGLAVVQLTSPASQPNFYGFSPEPRPELIATWASPAPVLSLSRPLERDRAVDETGGQVAVFGRRGSRPFQLDEMQRLYLDARGEPWFVDDAVVAP
jgi:hypothetical protein